MSIDAISRRQALERMCAGFGMVGLSGLLGRAAADGPHHRPRAKRVIQLFMNGGPSHVDTFDPKPALRKRAGEAPKGKLYRKNKGDGFMPSPLRFHKSGRSGIEVSETLPNIARVIDDCCVIRSMRTDVPNHEPGLLMMQTGHIQPVRPSMGSWILYGLGTWNENLPGYVVLRPSPNIVVGPALWGSSFLPAQVQATSVMTSDMRLDKLMPYVRNPQLGPREQGRQIDLLGKLNRLHLEKRNGDAALDAEIRAMETAFRMQREAATAFDIESEPAHIRKRYGETTFARSCLLARRLAESGVRFVTVYYTDKNNQPWDTHQDHDSRHRKLCADSDRATAALIADLKDRGMLDDTLVVWGGEFGRTPYSEKKKGKSKPGRDHHHTAFSVLLAGGGVKGGLAYGASDELGMDVTEDPVHVHDLHATILHLLGLDHKRLTFRSSGRDFRLTDVHGEVVTGILA